MPKRRDHGQGALFYLESRGLWRGVVDNGFNDDGSRRQAYVHSKSREECVKKLRRLTKEIAEHGQPLDHRMRVAELAQQWIEEAGARLKPKTMQGYRSTLNASVIPILGNRVAAELQPTDVRRMHAAIFARNVGAASVAGAHRTLSALLGYGVDNGILARNVAAAVAIPRQPPSARDSFTRSEAEALLGLGDPRWSLPLLSGARDGEMRGLRNQDLDLDHDMALISWTLTEVTFNHGCGGTCGYKRAGRCPQRTLDIAPNLEAHPLEGRWALLRPKNYQPRPVPLTPDVSAALRAHLDADTASNPHDLVWHRNDGSPLGNADSNQAFRDAMERAGVRRPATTHWLRHTYTTLAEHAGIPWVVYSRISGHSSEGVSRLYTHRLEQEARGGVEALATFITPTDGRR